MDKIKEVIERIKVANRMLAEENNQYANSCIENNNIAIAALEEKLERSKGCEYCMEQNSRDGGEKRMIDESKNKVFCSADYCRKLKAENAKLKEFLKRATGDIEYLLKIEQSSRCDKCQYGGELICHVGDCREQARWSHEKEVLNLIGDEEDHDIN